MNKISREREKNKESNYKGYIGKREERNKISHRIVLYRFVSFCIGQFVIRGGRGRVDYRERFKGMVSLDTYVYPLWYRVSWMCRFATRSEIRR